MKKILSIFLIGIMSFSFVGEKRYRKVKNTSFHKGEYLRYRVHYGWLTAGGATMKVSKTLYKLNGRPCYRVDTRGYTAKSFNFMYKVNDLWRSYIDTSAMVSQKFFRHLEENKYRKDEEVFYNHNENKVRVVDVKRKVNKKYKVPANAQDMISGYYYLRTINFKKKAVNDTITIPGFVEDTSYKLKLVYKGKGVVKNRLGKIRVLKLQPIIPKNEFFDGENSLRVWVSDDKNKIPVKIEADMFIGSIEVDLEAYAGIKEKLNKVK